MTPPHANILPDKASLCDDAGTDNVSVLMSLRGPWKIAELEGLEAHAKSVSIRLKK